MGFFTGRLTCTRFRVGGPARRTFRSDDLDKLAEHAIGRQRVATGEILHEQCGDQGSSREEQGKTEENSAGVAESLFPSFARGARIIGNDLGQDARESAL